MRWVLGLVLGVALAGVAWLLVGGEGDDLPEVLVGDAHSAVETPPPRAVTLQGLGVEGLKPSRVATGGCALQCRVLRDGKPAPAAVEVRFLESTAALQQQQQWWQRWTRDLFQTPVAPAPPTAAGTTDAQGLLLLEGLAPGGYRVSAVSADGWRADANGVFQADRTRLVVTLDLRAPDQSLEGRITWSDGKPVAGSVVLTPPLSRPMGQPSLSTTLGQLAAELGPDGSFRLSGLVAGVHHVKVVVPTGWTGAAGAAFATTGPSVTLPTTKPYALVLDMPGQRLTGRVLNGTTDAPVAGASVMGSGSVGANLWGTVRVFTGEDGRFELLLPRLPTTLYANAAGFGMVQRYVMVAGTDVTIRLLKTARIAGRVTTKAGAPAVGAVVGASCGSPNMGWTRFTAVADRDGHYALEDVLAGEAVVVVRGGGWTSPEVADTREGGFNPFVLAVPGGGSVTLDLQAVPTGRIEGKVLDASGAPVAGAGVTANVTGTSHGGQVVGRLTSALGSESAGSDANGAFVLSNLSPGFQYSLTAVASDQPMANAGPFLVSADAPTSAEVKFPAARFVDVRVLYDGDEAPVPDATVWLVAMQPGGGWNNVVSCVTDREGRARAGPTAPMDLGVTVFAESAVPRQQPVAVEGTKDGPGPFAVTLRLARGRTIEGRVLKPDGTPAFGAWVNAHQPDSSGGRHSGTTTALDGTFTLKGLAAGVYNVGAQLQQPPKPNLYVNTQAESGATGLTLTLVEPAAAQAREAIVVKVLDDRGEPVRSAQTRLVAGQNNWGNHVNEGMVRYEFDRQPGNWIWTAVSNGTLYVDVWAARSWADLPLATAPTRVGPLGSEQREVEVRLAAERAIEGRVVTSDGSPVRGVLVRARATTSSNDVVPSSGEGRCDERGRFRVGGLGEGDHALDIAVPPDFLTPTAVTAAAGARNVEIRLVRGTTARVRVLDADGQPLAKANVTAHSRAPDVQPQPGDRRQRVRRGQVQSQVNVLTGVDGLAVLRGLDPDGLWTLSVGPNREDLRGFSQDRWTPADTDVRLERGYVVSGVVRDPQGRALPGSQVMRKIGESGWNGIGVGQDGTFRITGLDRGSVSLAAWAPGVNVDVNDPNVQVLTVAAGTENVVLTVDPGWELVVRVTNPGDRDPRNRQLQFQLVTRRGEQWVQAGHANDQEGSGRVVFRGLKPDERYTVWVQPNGSDFYGWLADVKPGGGEVTLRLERGGTIRGRLTLPAFHEHVGVGANNEMGFWLQGQHDADGRLEIRGVPPGTWKVHAWANVQGQHCNATADATAGSHVDLRLEAPPPR